MALNSLIDSFLPQSEKSVGLKGLIPLHSSQSSAALFYFQIFCWWCKFTQHAKSLSSTEHFALHSSFNNFLTVRLYFWARAPAICDCCQTVFDMLLSSFTFTNADVFDTLSCELIFVLMLKNMFLCLVISCVKTPIKHFVCAKRHVLTLENVVASDAYI